MKSFQLTFGLAQTEMTLRVSELWGLVNPAASKLQYSGTKLELGTMTNKD